MLYREIIAVCSKIHTKHKYTVWAERRIFTRVYGKLHKATTSSFPSVCLSVRMEQLGSHWTDFHEI